MNKHAGSERNLTLVMDLYELTMAYNYFKQGNKDQLVYFDMFYRKNPDNGGFAVFAGTCSILKEENEGLLKRVLKSSGGELVPIGEEWTKELPLLPNAMPGTLLVGPDELFEGFFVAKIRKK